MENKARMLIMKMKEKFPPAENDTETDLTLTTEEIQEIILKHDPKIKLKDVDMTFLLEEAGYQYQAVERNDTIIFAWLLKENSL